MNECEDFLHQMDSQSKREIQQYNPLDDNSDEMEFGSQPAGIQDDEGYENVQTEEVDFKPAGSRNNKKGKFASYLENNEPMLNSSPDLKKRAQLGASIEDVVPVIKSAAYELDVLVEQVTDQLLMNQLPHPGNLRSHKKKDIKQRIRCFQALLQQKEKSFQTKSLDNKIQHQLKGKLKDTKVEKGNRKHDDAKQKIITMRFTK